MTKQALNSMELFKGNNPSTIKRALKMQSKSVVNELMDHFNARDLDELSVKLSIGK